MKTMTHKGFYSAMLLAVVAAGTAAHGQGVLPPPLAAPPASVDGALTHESLRQQLDGLGYEFKVETSSTNSPMYLLDFTQNNFRYVIYVALTSDQKLLFLDASLKNLPALDQLPAERLLRLLEENTNITPKAFRYDKSLHRMYLTWGMENKGFKPAELRKAIGDFMQVLSDTQPLWNPAKWQTPAVSQTNPGSELGSMQGVWLLKSGSMFGQPFPQDVLGRNYKCIIAGNQLTMFDKTFAMEVNPADRTFRIKQPDGTEELGMYRIEGTTMKLCIGKAGSARPKDFEPSDSSIVMTLEATAPNNTVSAR